MKHLSTDEIASLLIARLAREAQYFAASFPIQDGASADEIWNRFVESLSKSRTSTTDPSSAETPRTLPPSNAVFRREISEK